MSRRCTTKNLEETNYIKKMKYVSQQNSSERTETREIHIFYRQLDFSSEPGVANEILENEPKSCLMVA